ncbi:hypothetical protein PLESTB_000856800 [Pleodorina starrii]|uniref:Uncharacterized protein n=1 Tax=Pleodorina starrii TaxID=330485 RepID=A0A9W6F2V5_9CHLO|nr:hypothetical protein PLESTM_001437000 [Pleodorina starrii]GLC54372.1 hypothetical protein PLESTB_000856800 [Pleodorina starrii]GLC72023.1 hypothetical protein PLESTF_001196000 [Pleodorina starrii]
MQTLPARNARLQRNKVCGSRRSHHALRHVLCAASTTSVLADQVLDRRAVLFGTLGLCGGALAPPSHAGVLDGTVEWWKSRKRANSAKLIAPIKVAQQRLEAASVMLANGSGSMVDVLQLVRASSLNCYLFEALPTDTLETRASLFSQSSNLSDPCTFRIIVKNVVDFASEEDKERGAQLLNSLILSYQKLDSELESAALDNGGATDPAAAGKAAQQLAVTLQLAYDMEGFVKEVLLVV